MKRLLMMIGATAVAVGANAGMYSYTDGAVSPADGKVAIQRNGSGEITSLTMAADDAEPVALTGDALAFAAGATVSVAGGAVVSNTFTAAGAIEFKGVTNATWNGGSSYIEGSEIVVFKNVSIDCILPLQGYGMRGNVQETVGDEDFLYKAFNVIRDEGKIGFEMQLYHYTNSKYYRKGMFIELSQSGNDVVGKRLATGYVIDARNDSLGVKMFEYSNGAATAKSDVTTSNTSSYKLKTLTICPSTLTFAVSGTATLNAVSGSGLTVTFEGASANAAVKASGANTMTSGAFIVKGDAQNPIVYDVAAKKALPPEVECQGTATLKFSAAGDATGGVSQGTGTITMRQGSTLNVAAAYPFYHLSGNVVLDGATMTHATSGNAYLNYLTLTNGATVVSTSTGTFRAGFTAEEPKWTVTGDGKSVYTGALHLLGKTTGGAAKELTIEVQDTVAGEDVDFLLTGDVTQDSTYKNGTFAKTGAGTMELNGTLHTSTEPVRVAEGTLLLGKSGACAAGVSFSLSGGTLALADGTANTAAVAVSENSSVAFGSGATLVLASLTIAEGTTLALGGDVGETGLKVETALDADTLGRIAFADGRTGKAYQSASGYVRRKNGLIISVH